MAIIHCLWIGALAGLVAGWLVGRGANVAPIASSMAVGVLGALLGALAVSWVRTSLFALPNRDLWAAAIGATVALTGWLVAQRTLMPSAAKKSAES